MSPPPPPAVELHSTGVDHDCVQTLFCTFDRNASVIVPYISEVLFNEPPSQFTDPPWRVALIPVLVGVFSSVGSTREVLFTLFLIVGTALSGITESML